MNTVENQQTIIQKSRSLGEYPFEALTPPGLRMLNHASARLRSHEQTRVPILLRYLECFLQITGETLHPISLSHPNFAKICQHFVGAIYCKKFIDISVTQSYVYAKLTFRLFEAAKEIAPTATIPNINLLKEKQSDDAKTCVRAFEAVDLIPEKVWLWRGWSSTNRNGKKINFQLYRVFERLGKEFTEKLARACDEYFSARQQHKISCLSALIKFIHEYPQPIREENFLDPSFITKFWRNFLLYYLRTGHASGATLEYLTLEWRNQFRPFVIEHLVKSGLLAETWGEFPCPAPQKRSGARTHLKSTNDGYEIKTKLLTDVPLHITDEEAMQILFEQIPRDINIFQRWAKCSADQLWEKLQYRNKNSALGKVRHILDVGANSGNVRWLTNRENPDHIKNAASTFAKYGFIPSASSDNDVKILYPNPLPQTARELALPTTNSLLPHCIILVANHPEITPGFLETLELFDKNEKLVGFIKSDSGNYKLVGAKKRRGPRLAQQIIDLSPKTAEIVEQVIAITEPIRSYLKANRDDAWRYFLLTCATGFSYPKKINRLATCTSTPLRVEKIAQDLGNFCDLDLDQRRQLAKRFSLSSLRASAGVMVYLDTRSGEKMAKALGHTSYNHSLLERYLPASILEFFNERWIRIFQTGIIVEALKESDYLMEAAAFKSMDELNIFLKNHCFKTFPRQDNNFYKTQDYEQQGKTKEIAFGVNTEILTLLISLQQAVSLSVSPVGPKAKYWASISEALVIHIESFLGARADLQLYLKSAREAANPSKMFGMLNE